MRALTFKEQVPYKSSSNENRDYTSVNMNRFLINTNHDCFDLTMSSRDQNRNIAKLLTYIAL